LPAKVAAMAERFYGEDGKHQPIEVRVASVESRSGQSPPLATPVAAAVKGVKVAPATTTSAPAGGIDLGTPHSLVAHVDAQGRPCSIPNAAGDLLTPSVVLFEEGGTVVGKEAVLASAMEPDKVAECVKRDMGAKVYRKQINGEYLPPELISSLI